MRILITGGNGFLGKHVLPKLQITKHLSWAPSSAILNVLDKNSLFEYIKDLQIDTILHMSAACGGILANQNSPADFLYKNTLMALNIYEVAKEADVETVYSLGSVCAYPKYCPIPLKEDDIWNGAAEETNFPYSQAKRTLMMLGQTYRQQYGIKGAHLIPVNMYGEHDHFDLTNSHVIPALIRKFDNATAKHLPQVECWGSGEASREFLYAGDTAGAIVQAIQQKLDTNLPINLGTGVEISIKDLAYLIKDLTGYQGQVVFTGEVSDGQPRRCLDVSRAKALLNWTAQTDLKTGLVKTIEWYRANKQRIMARELDVS